MPAHGFIKRQPMNRRVKVQFTVAQEQKLMARAKAVGMSVASYLRALALNDLGPDDAPRPSPQRARSHAAMLQVAEFHALAMQVKKLGTNVNQLARQANTGMVPITRAEVTYLLNHLQVLMSLAKAVMEKMLG